MLLELWPTVTDDSGTKTDGTVINQTLFDEIRDAIEDIAHSLNNPDESPALTTDEVVAARGNKASLDARLSVLLDDDGRFAVGGVVQRYYTDVTQHANSGTDETDLGSVAIPANTLTSNGQFIHGVAWGSFAANGNTKTIAVYFGATLVTLHAATTNNAKWRLEFDVIRTGAATQILLGILHFGSSVSALVAPVTPAEDLTGAVTVKITGDSSAASSDILQDGFIVTIGY